MVMLSQLNIESLSWITKIGGFTAKLYQAFGSDGVLWI
jgi:hypothetical protein